VPAAETGSTPGSAGATAPLSNRFDLDNAAFVEAPFRYATFERCLDSRIGERLLVWFESTAPWHHVETDFYEQHEFSCWDSAAPEACTLTSEDLLGALRAEMTRLFGCQFRHDITVVAHRLVPGHRIGIHNDYLPGQETHRFVVQLNRGLSDADGGFLMLFSSSDPADVHKVLRPTSLSGLAFEISPSSYHAISQMHGNVRYSIVYSFYASAD
jgi:hypothetical protein